MTRPQKVLALVLLLTATSTAVAALVLTGALAPGVLAEVTNAGATPLRDLRLHVTGRSYSLGDLAPHDSRAVPVNPTGESHLDLSYTDPAGARQSLTADCYFESGYTGRIAVDVADGKVTRVKSEARPRAW